VNSLRKFNKLWKDSDIIILVSKHFTEKDFYNTMLYIGSTLYGITDGEVLNNWFKDLKGDVSG
jgi:hypothetical protein